MFLSYNTHFTLAIQCLLISIKVQYTIYSIYCAPTLQGKAGTAEVSESRAEGSKNILERSGEILTTLSLLWMTYVPLHSKMLL
jgi:hypothetical protein